MVSRGVGDVPSSQEGQLSLFHSPRPSADLQRENLMALYGIRGLGEVSLKALLAEYADLGAVWERPPDELGRVLATARLSNVKNVVEQICTRRRELQEGARRELERLERQGVRLVTTADDCYPGQLRGLRDRPEWLFVQGNLDLVSSASLVAVVGTREVSPRGAALARDLTIWLSERGFGIVSGLADGVDQIAHQTALDFGAPTIGVMGTGISISFPAAAGVLREQIISDGGAIVTEYFPHETYSRTRFIRRNRIVAGLSYATVPVEAKENSGTAYTYRYAREYGRVTFGVTRSSAPGVNGIQRLLRQDGSPVFDLDLSEERCRLEKILRPAMPSAPTSQARRSIFGSLVREFRRVVQTYSLSQADVDQLKRELDTVWRESGERGH